MTMSVGFDLSPLLWAASLHLGRGIAGDVRWMRVGQEELDSLTDSDRHLVHVVTGERLPQSVPESGILLSFFALQLAADRMVGPLRDREDVSIEYLEDVYTAYETCQVGNPVSGELLDLALAYLAGRELALLGPDSLL
ncbi:hypothetical protein [Gephyromycinifex aptenodytis]|uniref:hypothetical protein n=1 Tax=Gephyromycinifex aptenodytis TaxID=2716227 RepID=UPI001445C2D5|nr:hypothetical protein [Gephyromycinifex aptenodytis]